jgi:hypothetical protein
VTPHYIAEYAQCILSTDSNKEFDIFLDISESDSDSGADILPLSSNLETETEIEIKKSQRNSIGTRIQALSLFEHWVPYKKITAQTSISRSSLYKLRSKAIIYFTT